MPSHGRTITKITQSVLPPPPRSLLRKMSPRTQNRHMNHAKNRKNSNRASRNEPLSLNMRQPFKEVVRWIPPACSCSLMRSPAEGHPPARMSRGNPAPAGDLRGACDPLPTRPLTGRCVANIQLRAVSARQLRASSSADSRRLGPPDSEVARDLVHSVRGVLEPVACEGCGRPGTPPPHQ